MALVFKDRVQETTTTTGTGTLTLAGAVAGYQPFSVVGNGALVAYTITDAANNFEVGTGTYTLSGTTLSRSTILASSNSNAAVSFAAGTKTVFLDLTASFLSDLVLADAAKLAGNLDVNGNQIISSSGVVTLTASGPAIIALGGGDITFTGQWFDNSSNLIYDGNGNLVAPTSLSTPLLQVGAGGIQLATASGTQAEIIDTASAANFLTLTGGAAATPATVTIGAAGSSTNINVNIAPKGSGVLKVAGTQVLTGNQSITLSGDIAGSGTTAITTTLAASGVGAGTYTSVTVNTKGLVTGGTNPSSGPSPLMYFFRGNT